MQNESPSSKGELVLVTGATGYIGGRLVPELLASGYRVRVMARQPRHLSNREWFDQVEIIHGDASSPESLIPALSEAAYAAHVQRIIYLGGLYPKEEKLSLT